MKMRKWLMTAMLPVVAVAVSGCGSTKVGRVDSGKEIALTDRWNAEDSRQVSQEMIGDMMSFPWVQEFTRANRGKRPTVIVQRIANKSHEHIATDTFVNDIKRAVIRSGKADFVAGGAEREALREEKKQQDVHASEKTRVEMGQESGANFALSGSINSFVDQLDGKRVTFYQVDLKLINVETTREVWNGQKKIQKLMERSRFGL
ncbi:MAG: penicillin-binding protein activator LpoB [Betaproteobacteria bacterium]|nr:penicillin-binding protein activator LpoB [Betaproteobacteria bacterium]